ncbi:hypothetical protein MSPGM_15350 [Methylorubrum sp. GM97]|nr:hypothetical protein MSPGM_15350 [Methylorubrum sp. GM97]
MAALAEDLGRPVRAGLRGHGGLTAEVFSDLAAVEGLWRGLEADPAVLMTPYQRFDWVAAYLGAGIDAGEATRILVLRDAHGRARVLIPLTVGRRGPLRVARVVGDRHANFHMPLFASREAAAMPAEDLTEALIRAGRAAGIDAFALRNQPRVWDGTPNPLAGGGLPAPSDAYGMLLGPDAEATLRRVFSGDTRKKLRAKERKLVEFLGAVEHRVAETPEAAAEIQAAFYAQKAARFADLGIADPYAEADIRRFIATATARTRMAAPRRSRFTPWWRARAVASWRPSAARWTAPASAGCGRPSTLTPNSAGSAPARSCCTGWSAIRPRGAAGRSTSASARRATRPRPATRPSNSWSRPCR